MNKLVITTVGTSLAGKELKLNDTIRMFIKRLSEENGYNANQILNNECTEQSENANACEIYLKRADLELKDYTAEIASLKLMNLNSDDTVILLCSDTPDGAFCGLVNQKYISETMGINCELKIIDGLEAKEAKNFLAGLETIIKLLNDTKNESIKSEKELILNITGGYKGVIPFLSLFAKKNKRKIVYLYQDSELIEIIPDLIITSKNQNGEETARKDNQQGLF